MTNPSLIFAVSLVTSLVLWLPTMMACLRAELGLPAAGLRYLAALAVSRLAVGGLARLVSGYQAAGPGPAAAEPQAPPGPRRRKDDQAAA